MTRGVAGSGVDADPNKYVYCEEKDCPAARTRRRFTVHGLKLHDQRMHPSYLEKTEKPLDRDLQKTTENVEDPGTVGDSVVMGEATRLIDDIRSALTHDEAGELDNWVTPEYAADDLSGFIRGWRVRGRKFCCNWTERGAKHTPGYTCTGFFVPNPNLSEERNLHLYGRSDAPLAPGQPEHTRRPAFKAPAEFEVNPVLEEIIMGILGWRNASGDTPDKRKDQIKRIVASVQSAPVEISTNERGPANGTVWLRARGGKFEVNIGDGWQVWSVDQLIGALQLTARIL